jgi:hypothetical protein
MNFIAQGAENQVVYVHKSASLESAFDKSDAEREINIQTHSFLYHKLSSHQR